MNKTPLYYSVYQNYINPFFYIYNENDFLISSGWILYKKIFLSKNIKHRKWIFFEKELDLYFLKKIKYFSIKTLNNHNTNSFSYNVYQIIKDIPFGETISYKDIACRLNNLKAVRAVGNICGKNLYPLVIPCHRILSKNGIGGYMGKNYDSVELQIKKMLLKHENYLI